MRILMLTTYFPPDSAANGILMDQLAEDLVSLGHDVNVVTTFPHYDSNGIPERYRGKLWSKELRNGLRITRLYLYVPKQKKRLIGRALNYATWNVLSTLAGLSAGRADVIFVPSPPLTNGLAGHIISLLRGAPYVYNVQDIYPDVAVRLGILKGRRLIGAFRLLERYVYAKAGAVSVISEGFGLNLRSKGVPADKLHMIPNFADMDFIRPLPRRNAFSAAQGLDGRFVVLFAGNVGLSQGLERVLDAAELVRGFPEILFLIVGNGAAKPALVDAARCRNLDHVVFRPFFPYRDVPLMYASSDVGLVPLKRGLAEESVPSKAFSILAAARPMIASVDGSSETCNLIRQAGCGLCVPPEDPQALAEAVLLLFRDRDAGVRMGLNGRAFGEERYSRRRIAVEYESLFKRVLEGRA